MCVLCKAFVVISETQNWSKHLEDPWDWIVHGSIGIYYNQIYKPLESITKIKSNVSHSDWLRFGYNQKRSCYTLHFVCPRLYPPHVIWQLCVDAKFSSLSTTFPKACYSKDSPPVPVILAQEWSTWITCAGVLASPLISSAEHVVCDVVVHVHSSANVAGYNRHLHIKHTL